ncbi:hypothetical protein EMPS_04440 [Entomortierella parvispora]|uniref:Uncharacterized protein n=1 Tax=Entomortierella parvispora TaxID=205924 RepID=A0A9P3LVH3_9FUNG|nr:hypothetical protein EMPS_04440 [Entomortierella parvispora]
MFKSTILLLALCTAGTFAKTWHIQLWNNAGKTANIPIVGNRFCVCLETTQTAKIKNTDGGVVKLFSTNDCTGNFAVLGAGATRTNAQWVNSASVGQDGIPSTGPTQCDPAL